MALVKGICKNFGECDLADNKEVQEVDKTNFVCEECGKPLHPVEGGSKPSEGIGKGPNKKLIALIAGAVLVVAGGGYGIWNLFGGGSDPQEKIAKIKLDKENVTLLVEGKSKTIKASIIDKEGKTVEDAEVTYQWATDDSNIATVTQQGEVTAVNKGNTTITVTIDGNKKVPSATGKINVKEAPSGRQIENIVITGAKDFTLKKGDTKKLEYKAEPADYNETLEWESSNPDVATVDANGLVTAVKNGTAKITGKTPNVTSAPITVTVTEAVDQPKPWAGYASFDGTTMTFKKRHVIPGTNQVANPGDKVTGKWVNGEVNLVRWYHDGTSETLTHK